MTLKKAQIAFEFIVLVGIVYILVTLSMLASLDRIKEFQASRENNLLKDLAQKLQKEIIIASTVEDGYSRNFTIPYTLGNNIGYNLSIVNNETLIVYSGRSSYMVFIPKITGNISKNKNTITKEGGVINLN